MQLRALAALALFALPLSGSESLDQNLKRIFASRAFASRSFGPARWIRNGAAFTTLEASASNPAARDIIEYDTATGKRTVLVAAAQLQPAGAAKPLAIEDYGWDEDLKRLLVFTESRRTWRTNTRGDYWVLDRTAKTLKKLGGDAPASSLMFAKFSPDGASAAYVRGNNLYVEDLATGAIRALTSDGSETIVNGSSDWVYEEELNLRDAFRWSPDGKNIAFWQFDQSQVEQFTIINDTDSLYPKVTRFPYPKAGTKNAAVRIGVVAVAGGAPRWMQVPGDPRENYIFRADWATDRELAIGQLNRKQNTATVYIMDPSSGSGSAVFRDQDEAWVDLPEGGESGRETEYFLWLKGRKSFLWLSERDGWRRAYTVALNGSAPVAVTPANQDVMAIQSIDPEGHWLYYLAAPKNATQRYLYRSPLDAHGAAERLTPDSQPGAHRYDISPDCRWAFHTWSSMERPPVIELAGLPAHKTVRVLEDNGALRAAAAGLLEPAAEFLQVQISDGVTVDGWMLRPRNFDPAKKYPVLVYVYGEPANTTVTDSWQGNRGLFHRALANEGYLVVSFDTRGTPAPKGRAWRKSVYGAVGVLTAKEQTESVYALAKSRPFVDLNRVGVWGWSGGGTNTLNLMFRSPDLFRVGISVAPVPDQKLYDTIYQERYMGLPDENAEGYRSGSAINFAESLRGDLLLIHGSGDDNVHYQGTERLVNRLVELGKPFDFMAYPNRSHGIFEGAGTSLHLYSLISRYLLAHLAPGPR